jgi:hypothetical protein
VRKARKTTRKATTRRKAVRKVTRRKKAAAA